MTTRNSIGRWLALRADLKHAANERDRAQQRLDAHVQRHLARYPLSEKQKRQLLTVVRDGGQLCCEHGRETLARYVDSLWADHLNEWAYEALACRGSGDRAHWVAKLKAKLVTATKRSTT